MNTKLLYLGFLAGSIAALSVVAQVSAKTEAPKLSSGPLITVPSLDVARYMGTWYEIAKYANYFQRKCVRNTRADYQLQANGMVLVTNRCIKEDGTTDEAVGAARQIGPASSPKLEVRFAPAWMSFLPAVWGNYWVVDLDPDYQLVAVSEPKREYLWILARTPQVSPDAYSALLQRLQKQGFDLQKLQLSPTTP